MQQKFHLIGVGGSGMGPLAQLLLEMGQIVTGTDQKESGALGHLKNQGARIIVGQDSKNVDPQAIVVYSSAIKENNPEMVIARSRGQKIWHRSEALDWICRGQCVVAVAGTHGKTTTSALIVQMLTALGHDVSFMIGSTLPGFNSGAHLSKEFIEKRLTDPSNCVFVIEADESDGSFLNYHPQICVVTNIEADHLDHWGDQTEIEQAFARFTALAPKNGAVVLCADDPGTARLAQQIMGINEHRTQARKGSPSTGVLQSETDQDHRTSLPQLYLYGFSELDGKEPIPCGLDAYLQLSEEKFDPDFSRASVTVKNKDGNTESSLHADLSLPLAGKHNLLNSAAALQVANYLGFDVRQCVGALAQARGSARRMQLRGEVLGVRVFDDYAHHPTEVEAALSAARQRAGHGRVLVLFQPHLYSRTRNFAQQFAKALSSGDEVVVCSVFGAREEPIPGVESNVITDLMDGVNARFIPDPRKGANLLLSEAKPGDVLLVMGAGDITDTAKALVSEDTYENPCLRTGGE